MMAEGAVSTSQLKKFLLALVVSGSACYAQVTNEAYKSMLERMYKKTVPLIVCETFKNSQAEFTILDTREQAEFRVSHIQNSKWIGYDDFDARRLEGVPKDANLVVYCSVGYRSERIGEKLLALGYSNVKNLYGGIFEWVNEGGKIYDSKGEETKNIHAFNALWGIWLQEGKKVY